MTEERSEAVTTGEADRAGAPRTVRKYRFRLYVAGARPQSTSAVVNIGHICQKHFTSDEYELDVINIYEQPDRAIEDGIIAVPTLVKYSPPPVQRVIGDLSDERVVLSELGLLKPS